MPYILSKLANTQTYTQYVKGMNNMNIPEKRVEVKGGADVTDKNFITPEGVVTKISAGELDVLKANKDFQRHLERGHVKYFGTNPNMGREVPKMEKDNSKPLTPDDYKKQGKKTPKTEA